MGSGDRKRRLRARMGEDMVTDTMRRMLAAIGVTEPVGETRKKYGRASP
jgi:hypothetical protein